MGGDALVGLPPAHPRLGPEMLETLNEAWQQGIFTKGNMARSHANPIAEAACRQWITTEAAPAVFGNRWLITARGLEVLRQHQQQESKEQ